MLVSKLNIFIHLCVYFVCVLVKESDAGYFNNNPGTVYLHENTDALTNVWANIDAICTVTYSCRTYTCQYYWGWGGWLNLAYTQYCRTVAVYYACTKNVQCNSCAVTSNWYNSMFYTSGKNVYKKACSDSGCGPTCSSSYCMNSGDYYTINVQCWHSSYPLGYGHVSTTFYVYATDNTPPSIWLEDGSSVTIDKSTHGQNSYVNRIRYSDPDGHIGVDTISYYVADTSKFTAWDFHSRSDHLFYLNTGNGYLYVKKDLSSEWSYTYTGISLCVCDRRDCGICTSLTITLVACFDKPSCYDQGPQTFSDQHGIGDTLFTFTYPAPSRHFPHFRSNWRQLQWTLEDSDLDVAAVDYYGGVLKTSGNITVWPSYPSRTYYAVIRVGNSESCGWTNTCRMTFTVTFTNWPIRFVNLPTRSCWHENVDEEFKALTIRTYDYNNPAHDNVTCRMAFSPEEENLFELRHDGGYRHDSWSIWRLACDQPKCEYHCPLNTGCFTHDTTANNEFVFTVRCDDFYGSMVEDTFTLCLEDNSPPYFTAANVDTVYISKETHGKDSFVTRMFAVDDDQNVDNDYIRWNITDDTKLIPWDYPNVTRTDRLFYINGLTGDIYVKADLSMEYSYVFRDIQICIADRRDAWICRLLTIWMTACYEIPTCYDQEYLDFWDTHGVDETLFDLLYPSPSYHFPVDFRSDWQDLTWSLDETDLSEGVVVQNEANGINEGIFRPYMNITVWPSWRYRDYYAVIRVNNEESCGRETTCVLTFRIWFKNWPIRFINLPAEITVNEDYNDEFVPIEIITYDYNYHLHDYVTCEMQFVPHEDNLFELVHDGNYDFNSWSIRRLPCQEPTCGFHCDRGIGCFTYNTTLNQQFVFTIHCWDAYDSDVTDYFTIHLDYNRAPTFTNLPNTITVNSDKVSDGDLLYSTHYSDNENEDLHYNYTFSPDNGIWNDRLIFECDQFGNYYDNRANITSTVYYHDMPASTYYIYICGTERRNMICETLTVKIQDHCPFNPTCTGSSLTLPDTTAVGTVLFTVNAQQDASSGGSLTYSFVSPTPAYFHIDQASGDITVAKELKAVYPSKTYQLTAFVYDSEACNYGSCQFTVTSTFTNYPINISNLPATYQDLSEDTEINEPLIVIETTDQNPEDSVTCSRVSISSPDTADPIDQDLFRVTQTYSGSNVWFIENRELPEFTAAILEYAVNVECHDSYGSTAEATLTVTIKQNETPLLTNLEDYPMATPIQIDPSLEGKDSIVYTVSTSDFEDDPLLFTSEVDSSFNPLALTNDGLVYLRRDVSVENEDGISYEIKICINDTSHNLQPEVCGLLSVTFNSSQKYPVISNLPAIVDFPEDTLGGTDIFDVNVDDENLDSVHTFSMTVDPLETAAMFSLHAQTGVLTLQPTERFNYEERSIYTFMFSVKDQYLVGLEKKQLILNITNVNEPPSISLLQDSVTFDEDTIPFAVLASRIASCSDDDIADVHTFSIENSHPYSDYFEMDAATSKLSLAQEWDLETLTATTATLNVTCTDAGGRSSSDSISISVSPINEFNPVITPTSMTVTCDSETSVVDNLGEITDATDDDYRDNGGSEFYYDIVGVGKGKKFFTMTQTGQLRLRKEMNFQRDRMFEFTISVSDNDYTPRPRTAYCSVRANYTAPAKEVPEEPNYCITCTTEGKIVMAAFAVEACILLVMIAHCVRHCLSLKGNRERLSTGSSTPEFNTGPQLSTNASNNLPRPTQIANTTNDLTNRPPGDRPDDSNHGNSDDESISDDSDIDERLRQPVEPGNQPFPAAIDAAHVTASVHPFGSAWNYA